MGVNKEGKMRKMMLCVAIAALCLLVVNPQISLAQEKVIKIKYAHMGTPKPWKTRFMVQPSPSST